MGRGKHRRGSLPPEDRNASGKAIAASVDAARTLHEARARVDEVDTLAEALRKLRERNHFGEMVRAALNGR